VAKPDQLHGASRIYNVRYNRTCQVAAVRRRSRFARMSFVASHSSPEKGKDGAPGRDSEAQDSSDQTVN